MASRPVALLLQALLYAAFAAVIGTFSSAPAYRQLGEHEALLKLSFSQPGQLRSECRRRSPEELQRMAPNMRQEMDCPRERSPVTVELSLNGAILASESVKPAGVARDGSSTYYARFPVPAGEHRVTVRIDDSVRVPGFSHVREETVRLEPGRVFVVDFDTARGGILFR